MHRHAAHWSLLDTRAVVRVWPRHPVVLLEYPLDVWPFDTCSGPRTAAAKWNALTRLVLYASVAAAVASRRLVVLVVGVALALVVGAVAAAMHGGGAPRRPAVVPTYRFLVPGGTLTHPHHARVPASGTLSEMLQAVGPPETPEAAAEALEGATTPTPAPAPERFLANCQTQPWAPVEPSPLFRVRESAELSQQLATGYSTGNPLVSPQNPMGNPLTYDFYKAVNMDTPLASSVPHQELPRLLTAQTEFPEGLFIHPVPDPTRMARPVYFSESSEAGRNILQFLGTGYVGR